MINKKNKSQRKDINQNINAKNIKKIQKSSNLKKQKIIYIKNEAKRCGPGQPGLAPGP